MWNRVQNLSAKGTAGLFGLFTAAGTVSASGVFGVQPPTAYPWSHSGPFDAYDTASIRRGLQVYREVCSSCHSLDLIAFRNLVGVTHTEEEVKIIAKSYSIVDGPNDAGEMFERPGKPSDYFPAPYKNEEEGRAANGGALPPDLSIMVKARQGNEDYVFSLLTGYRESPAGINLREGLHFNTYFAGGAIGMAQPLFDEMVEYEDGTEPTLSQHAKDVSTFLTWAAMPEQDERKLFGLRSLLTVAGISVLLVYWKRFRFSVIKNQKIQIKNSLY